MPSSLMSFQAFGLVCSSSSNSIYDGKLAYVPALEDVLVWDVRKGQMVCEEGVFNIPQHVHSIIGWDVA